MDLDSAKRDLPISDAEFSPGIIGCGRTDAQVHASQYYFHSDLKEKLNPARREELCFILNKGLPKDIAIFDILEMPKNAHARFSCIVDFS